MAVQESKDDKGLVVEGTVLFIVKFELLEELESWAISLSKNLPGGSVELLDEFAMSYGSFTINLTSRCISSRVNLLKVSLEVAAIPRLLHLPLFDLILHAGKVRSR